MTTNMRADIEFEVDCPSLVPGAAAWVLSRIPAGEPILSKPLLIRSTAEIDGELDGQDLIGRALYNAEGRYVVEVAGHLDEENARAIVAHELAHVATGHLDAQRAARNVVDAAAARGDPLPEPPSGMVQRYMQDREAEVEEQVRAWGFVWVRRGGVLAFEHLPAGELGG